MERKNPLVSVIINCYNGEKYLREAIDSVIAQTYSNWEIIFWDNQSTDSSAEIVKGYNDDRIKYYYAPKHTPLGEARNLAMDKAQGQYLSFLDCDDLWMENCLEVYVKYILNNNYPVLLYSNYYCKNEKKIWKFSPDEVCHILNDKDFVSIYNIAISSALIKMDYLKKNNILFCSDFSLIEDYDFFLKLSISNNIFYISDPLMQYRYHCDNLSKKKNFGGEFQLLYNKIISGSGIYRHMHRYVTIVSERMNYVLANESINEKKRIKALSFILKINFFTIPFCRICLKMIVPFRILHYIEKKKYM